MSADPIRATCTACSCDIEWIASPTGGWWCHLEHPADGHDAISAVVVDEEIDERGYWVTNGTVAVRDE